MSSFDKLAHTGLYGILGLALAYGWHHDVSPPPHLALIVLGGLYGATDEWHQAFVNGRSPSWGDWIADMVGVTIGYVATLFIMSRVADLAMPTGRNADGPD